MGWWPMEHFAPRAVANLLVAMLAMTAPHAAAQTYIIYSHLDAAQAVRVRRLVLAYDAVGIDTETRPGDVWRPAIAASILAARTVLVLWSANAAASRELAPEILIALASGARVVPVLLDDTPLPPDLSARQGIDWRSLPGPVLDCFK